MGVKKGRKKTREREDGGGGRREGLEERAWDMSDIKHILLNISMINVGDEIGDFEDQALDMFM